MIQLNVGGIIYVTTKTTLCKSPYFAGSLSEKFSVDVDRKGNIFIDRNGEYFGYILEFLRSGYTIIPKKLQLPIQIESDFFQITLDLNQNHSTSPKALPLMVMVENCTHRNRTNHKCFKINGSCIDGKHCSLFGLKAETSNMGNFKWAETSSKRQIDSAQLFGVYLVNEKGYKFKNDGAIKPKNGSLCLVLSHDKDAEEKQNIVVISRALAHLYPAVIGNDKAKDWSFGLSRLTTSRGGV